MSAADFKSRGIRLNRIINSGSQSSPLMIYGLDAATDEFGGLASTFATGSDTWLFISGAVGSKGSGVQGSVTFAGDVTVSGSIYNGSGGTFGSAAGSDTWVQFNDAGAFGAASGFAFDKTTSTLTLAGDLAINGGDVTTTSTSATLFSTNVTSLSIGSTATTLTIGGSSTSTSFTFNLGNNRTGAATLNLAGGSTLSGSTKLINIGAGGESGSLTRIQIGTVDTSGTTSVQISGSVQVSGSITLSGTLLPSADTTWELGSPQARWAHIYTGDLHLRNERGDWTIIEEQDFLRLVNNKTGKNFRILTQEIAPL